VGWNLDPATRDLPFQSDFHQPVTYRGGMVASLQRMLGMDADGVFRPATCTGESLDETSPPGRSRTTEHPAGEPEPLRVGSPNP